MTQPALVLDAAAGLTVDISAAPHAIRARPLGPPGAHLFQQVLAHELSVTASINAIYDLSKAEKDPKTELMLHWFINEQVEEEAWAAEMVDRVKGATCAGSLSDLDRHIERLLAGDGKQET